MLLITANMNQLWPFNLLVQSSEPPSNVNCYSKIGMNTRLNCTEVQVYLVLLQHTGLYPIVSKGMRLIAQGKDPLEGQKHMCGMGNLFHYHSTGFPELDELMRTPQPLLFIMELVQVKGRGKKLKCHTGTRQERTDRYLDRVNKNKVTSPSPYP